jgi:hypothetical protein
VAWKALAQKELLPKDIHNVIDKQIQTVVVNTGKNFQG